MTSLAKATPSMLHYDTRLQSFAPITKPKSKAKPGFPLDAARYPSLTPVELASAGFFHDPGEDEETWDTCRCYICGLQLGGWDETDNPYEEHYKRGSCAWAEFVCGPIAQRAGKIRIEYKSQDTLPTSESSAKAREITYLKAWPHKPKAGTGPSVKSLAKAGFVLQASASSPDSVACPLCEYAVEGWEADDDPWSIHQKKSPGCTFFTAQLANVPPTKGKAPRKPRTTTKRVGMETAASQSEAQSDAPETGDDEASGSQPRSKTSRRAVTRGKAKRGEDETDLESIAETQSVVEDVVEPVDFGESEDAAARRGGRNAKGKAKADTDGDTELESVVESVVDDSEVKKAKKGGKTKAGKKKTGSKPSGSRTESEAEAGPSEVEVDELRDEKSARTKSTRSTRKAGGRAEDEISQSEMETQAASAESEIEVATDNGGEEEDEEGEDRRATIKSKPSKSKSKSSRSEKSSKSSKSTKSSKAARAKAVDASEASAADESEAQPSEVDDTDAGDESARDRRKTIKSKSSKSTRSDKPSKSDKSTKSVKSKSSRSKKAAADSEAESQLETSAAEDVDEQMEEDASAAYEPISQRSEPTRAKSTTARVRSGAKAAATPVSAPASAPGQTFKAAAEEQPSSSARSQASKSARSAPVGTLQITDSHTEIRSNEENAPVDDAHRSQSAPAPRKVAPKPKARTKKASAPPVPAAASAFIAGTTAQPYVLTQLDRFANVPPSSPFGASSKDGEKQTENDKDESTPRARKAGGAASASAGMPMPIPTIAKPTRPSTTLSRENLDRSLVQGAEEARKVIEGVVSSVGGGGADEMNLTAKLTATEKEMTLEELVKLEYRKRYEIMKAEGEEMISRWEERTRVARAQIEGL